MTGIQNYIATMHRKCFDDGHSADSILIDVFGDSRELTDQLVELVLAGTKTVQHACPCMNGDAAR